MKRLPILGVLLVAAVLPRPSLAAGDAVPLAVELAKLTVPQENWDKLMRNTSEQTRQYVEASIRQAGGTMPPEFPARFAEEFGKMYSYQEVMDIQAGLLVKHYTEGELRELLAFYRTPLGRKAIRIMPEVMADVNGQMMVLLQQRMPVMMERLKPLLEGATPAAR
jgi:hypothetical protein